MAGRKAKTSIYLDSETTRMLDELSKKLSLSRSSVARLAIREFYEKYKKG